MPVLSLGTAVDGVALRGDPLPAGTGDVVLVGQQPRAAGEASATALDALHVAVHPDRLHLHTEASHTKSPRPSPNEAGSEGSAA